MKKFLSFWRVSLVLGALSLLHIVEAAPSLILSGNESLKVTEGCTQWWHPADVRYCFYEATYHVKLSSAPSSGNVTVTLVSSSRTEDTSLVQLSFTPSVLSYTAATYGTYQQVSVKAVNDIVPSFNDTNVASITHLVSEGGANAEAKSILQVQVFDDDNAAVEVKMANLTYFINLPNDATANVTEGSSTGWPATTRLSSKPTEDVTVSFWVDASLLVGGSIRAEPSYLVFSAVNWNLTQQVVFYALDDSVITGTRSVALNYLCTTASPGAPYQARKGLAGRFDVFESDKGGVLASTSSIVTREGLLPQKFTLRLLTKPEVDVSIGIERVCGTVVPGQVPAPQGFYSIPEDVEAFSAIAVAAVTVQTAARRLLGLGAVSTERLSRSPRELLVAVYPSPEDRVQVSPQTITFSGKNWSSPAPVFISVLQDERYQGSIPCWVRLKIFSNDPYYSHYAGIGPNGTTTFVNGTLPVVDQPNLLPLPFFSDGKLFDGVLNVTVGDDDHPLLSKEIAQYFAYGISWILVLVCLTSFSLELYFGCEYIGVSVRLVQFMQFWALTGSLKRVVLESSIYGKVADMLSVWNLNIHVSTSPEIVGPTDVSNSYYYVDLFAQLQNVILLTAVMFVFVALANFVYTTIYLYVLRRAFHEDDADAFRARQLKTLFNAARDDFMARVHPYRWLISAWTFAYVGIILVASRVSGDRSLEYGPSVAGMGMITLFAFPLVVFYVNYLWAAVSGDEPDLIFRRAGSGSGGGGGGEEGGDNKGAEYNPELEKAKAEAELNKNRYFFPDQKGEWVEVRKEHSGNFLAKYGVLFEEYVIGANGWPAYVYGAVRLMKLWLSASFIPIFQDWEVGQIGAILIVLGLQFASLLFLRPFQSRRRAILEVTVIMSQMITVFSSIWLEMGYANVNWSFDQWQTLQHAIIRSGVELVMLGTNLFVYIIAVVFELRMQIAFYNSKKVQVDDEEPTKKGLDRGLELKSMLKKMDFDI